jgi:hypothetical protein
MTQPFVVQFDDREFAEFLRLAPREARKAGLYGLNDAGKVMQGTVRQQMAQRFTYRGTKGKTFLERQVKIDFYKSGKAEQVRVFTQGPNTEPDRQLLPKFDVTGGVNRDKEGGMLTVPVMARSTFASTIPARFRIKQLGLVRGRNGLLQSTTQPGVWADKKNIYRRTGRGRGTNVVVLYTFRRETKVPTPIRWNVAADSAIAAWPSIAGKHIAEKVGYLLRTGKASAGDFLIPVGE